MPAPTKTLAYHQRGSVCNEALFILCVSMYVCTLIFCISIYSKFNFYLMCYFCCAFLLVMMMLLMVLVVVLVFDGFVRHRNVFVYFSYVIFLYFFLFTFLLFCCYSPQSNSRLLAIIASTCFQT